MSRLVSSDLRSGEVQNRAKRIAAGHHEHPIKSIQKSVGDSATHLIAAGEQCGRTVESLPAGANSQHEIVAVLLAVRCRAVVRTVHHAQRRSVYVVGVSDRERLRSNHDCHIALTERNGSGIVGDDPTLAAQQGDQGERSSVCEADRPRWVHDGPAEQGAVGSHFGQQASQCIHIRQSRHLDIELSVENIPRLTSGRLTEHMTMKPILVLGGTGKTGRRVASRLQQRGHEVRAASRKGPTRFDWNDENTWEPALDGVGTAYLVDSQLSDAATSLNSFSRLAVSSGVERLVLLSVRDWVVSPGEEKLPCERVVRESGAEWTILKPTWFSQNFSEESFYRGQVVGGEVVMSTGEGVEPFIDVDDIADVAVAVLTEDGHSGQAYPLSGPRLLSLGAAVDEIAQATGRVITYRPVSSTEYATYAMQRGLPEEVVALLNMLCGWISEGRFAYLTDGVQRVLGREPRDFTDYARATAVTGVWNASRSVYDTSER